MNTGRDKNRITFRLSGTTLLSFCFGVNGAAECIFFSVFGGFQYTTNIWWDKLVVMNFCKQKNFSVNSFCNWHNRKLFSLDTYRKTTLLLPWFYSLKSCRCILTCNIYSTYIYYVYSFCMKTFHTAIPLPNNLSQNKVFLTMIMKHCFIIQVELSKSEFHQQVNAFFNSVQSHCTQSDVFQSLISANQYNYCSQLMKMFF